MSVRCSRGLEGRRDSVGQTALDQTAPDLRVPLLSREGPTRCLLPGAAAPWSPALDPVSKFPAVARFVFVFVDSS